MNTPTSADLGGKAAVEVLREVFAVDLTAAVGQCERCGGAVVLAEARLHVRAPGMVGRCPGCRAVLFRIVRGPDRTWLDLRGLRCIEVRTPDT